MLTQDRHCAILNLLKTKSSVTLLELTTLLNNGFIDTYRYFNPNKEGIYSWWSYRFNARENNAGWRIDYFCVSNKLKSELKNAEIHMDILGSDHCPVVLEIF